MAPSERLRAFDRTLPAELYSYNCEAKVRALIHDVIGDIDRYERALIEIEHHSTDANAAATARAALAHADGEVTPSVVCEGSPGMPCPFHDYITLEEVTPEVVNA